ncbi:MULTISPECIES: YchJ family protein [Pseudovibrio]|uniref:YchJ family protein n=1 Tax=Stappiaceae TaxID=2821832 RepID=UPI00236732F0|nr:MULTISPECIES: YchJ family metal-binding protein [Pseudovibrio]MDD7909369.1 YchJ family metal-binding protein [Pseudovibrio exalbescens]MDX5594928.1 YchJ family metal-binding protein [Pseudovibrio sp. SPO723]
MTTSQNCPCHSGEAYAKCCQPFIEGTAEPEKAIDLMRARYTAYTQKNVKFIRDTLWPPLQKTMNEMEVREWANETHWLTLDVLDAAKGSPQDKEGLVLFKAKFLARGQMYEHKELSLFRKKKDRWFYVEPLPLPNGV